MADALTLDLPDFSQIAQELRNLPTPQCADPFGLLAALNGRPARKGTVEKQKLKFQPISRKLVTGWASKLAAWSAVQNYRGNGRSVRMVYNALRDLMKWSTGRCDPAGSVIARWAGYSPGTFWPTIRWMKERNIVAVIPCCSKVVSNDGRFFLQQETNVYVFLPPSQWRGYEKKPEPPPPDPETWGASPPLDEPAEPNPLDQAPHIEQLRAKLREAEEKLASDPTLVGQAALVRMYRDNLAALDPPD